MTSIIDRNTRDKIAIKIKQGKTNAQIAEELIVSRRSAGRFRDKVDNNETLEPKHVDKSSFNNPNAKIDENYIFELKKSVDEKSELTLEKRSLYLEEKTNIKISQVQLRTHLKRLNATKKNYTTTYFESKSPVNQTRKKLFLKEHDPKYGINRKDNQYIPLLLTCSTDESGWENDRNVTKGYGFIRKIPPIKNSTTKKTSGRSYRDNSSRIYKTNLKHSKFKLNVIATICLDFETPVPYFEINEVNTTGSIYANYISNRTLPDHVKYDIIDRHSAHRSTDSNIKRGIDQ